MAMSPGNQAITGGTVLRAPAIQSPNYVPGVSGWIVRIDGSAEFNNGTFRGSIEVGPVTGQHFIVNNAATGDVIDVYDASNRLILKLDKFGNLVTYDQPAQDSVSMSGAAIQFASGVSPPIEPASLIGTSDATFSQLQISSGNAAAGVGFGNSYITLEDYASNSGLSNIKITQRETNVFGSGIDGSLVQTDTADGTNQLIHAAVYNGTVGTNGVWSFAHNCGFTPTGAILQSWDKAGVQTAQYPVLGSTPFSGGNCNTQWWNGSGTRVANGTAVAVNAVFFG